MLYIAVMVWMIGVSTTVLVGIHKYSWSKFEYNTKYYSLKYKLGMIALIISIWPFLLLLMWTNRNYGKELS